jgi:glyoxylase-like metal-dependent hydrolase (beta-lactamase superfamily II)
MLEGSGGNIGVLFGDDGIIMVDDQFAPLSDKIKKAITALSNKPISFIINTHFHFDHSGGNEKFGDGGVIVAHENVRKRLSADQFIGTNKTEQKSLGYIGLPKITFAESITFNMNGETIDVYHVKNAHTDGDALIYFKKSNVVHTGDVFVRYGVPFIDEANGGTVDGMITAINNLIKSVNDETKIIPGHGAISNKKDLLDYVNMLQTIKDKIADGIKKNKSIDEIIAADPAKDYKGSPKFKADFIKLVYFSLKK